MDERHGRTELPTLDRMKWAKSMVMGRFNGLMAQSSQESLRTITSMERELTYGLTRESMLEIGLTIRWKGEECSHGWTARSMRVSTETIRKKGMESSSGLTIGPTEANGRTESSMAKEYMLLPTIWRRKESGRMARGSSGSK